jgi:hypothetical protein
MLGTLFKFPIVMVDGDNEERKHNLGLPGEEEVDIIVGEAECPYYDFISITDRWLPTEESVRRAMDREFDACYVVFGASGSFVVPWNKKRFKEEYRKFVEKMDPDTDKKSVQVRLVKETLKDIERGMPDDED